ncbi:MAG: PD-(D/E)XK nuclease family protein [Rhodospirillaceae bacterium]|nr:PD-(D/E)XK nuclease family protein [Rhodospirillaceae bacterium]
MTAQDRYQRPAVVISFDDDGAPEVRIRASRLDDCRRRMWFVASEEPESDEVPPDSLARLEMSKMLEPYVLESLERWHGWAVAPAPDVVVEVPVSDEITFTGIPDALGYHDRTGNEPTVIEVKARSTGAFGAVVRNGNYRAQFAAVAQLAVYRQAMVEAAVVRPEVDSVIVTLNKDSGQLHHEWFSPDNLRLAMAEAELKSSFMLKRWEEGIPPTDYPPDSWQCRSCVFRTKCGNVMLDGAAPPNSGPVSLEQAAETIRVWEGDHLREVANRIDKDLDHNTRLRLLTYLQAERLPRVQVRGDSYWWTVSLRQREDFDWDSDALRYMLTPDQMERATVKTVGEPYVEIRRGKPI